VGRVSRIVHPLRSQLIALQPAREETPLPDAASARQSPAVMVPSSSTAAEGTAAGAGLSLCPRQGRLCSASRLLREAAGPVLPVVAAMLIGPRPVARLLDGERHAARAVFAHSHALHAGCGDAGRARRRPPGSGHSPAHARGRVQPSAPGEVPRREPHAGCAGRARLVQILLRYFARPAPTSGSSWRPAVKGTEQWIEAGGLASPPSVSGR
jgi:hypothetical protein